METKYYHRPITIPDFGNSSPLKDCVITFSSYGVCERQYLENVAIFLGAMYVICNIKNTNFCDHRFFVITLLISMFLGAKMFCLKRITPREVLLELPI